MDREIKYWRKLYTIFIIGILFLFIISFSWNLFKEYNSMHELAKIEASASYNKDLLYRRWAAMHGGVYAPVTDSTPPNKYLVFIPERDIETKLGKKLTLINPAYMTRQVFNLANEQYGVKGHITSLRPIRPENKPDDWEANALQTFEKGAKEFSSLEKIDGKVYMRYMHAMQVEQGCLKCHASQGYKIGDIRGGISVSVPMDKYYKVFDSHLINLIISHLLFFIIVLFVSLFAYRRFKYELIRRFSIQQKIAEREAELHEQNQEYLALNEQYKSQNQELQEAKERAEESDRLKTSFLQNLSHEIRTPMNAINGFAGLLGKPGVSPENQQNFTSIIINSSNQLLAVVTDILTISTLDTNQEKVTNSNVCINEILNEVFAVYKPQATYKNLIFKVVPALPDALAEIITDQTKLTQIISNLVQNAFKFTNNGTIEFGYKLIVDPADQPMLEFFVKDSGIGIKPAMHEKIFERFRQADTSPERVYGGTGLGLAIAKGFVELMGGKIWVESEPEKGANFFFTLPYKAVNNQNIETNLFAKELNGNVILVAEDEDYNFMYIEELLYSFDIKIIRARNGIEAVDICKTNPNIGLVLMDIKMPEMDGYTAAKLISEFRTELRIIAQTAYAIDHEIAMYGSVFDDYLTKPIKETDLLKSISKYLKLPTT